MFLLKCDYKQKKCKNTKLVSYGKREYCTPIWIVSAISRKK